MNLEPLRDRFEATFGHPPTIAAIAPGRVNLIGEHTDYNDGYVFPAAIDRGLTILASPTDGESRVLSQELSEGEAFNTKTVEPDQLNSWSKYPAGVAWVLRREGHQVPNLNVLLTSDVPIGSGVSSSAAIEMAFGVVWNELAQLNISNFNLALLGQKCENDFLGLKSGIMDQMASAMGREGQAMFLDTRSLQIEYAPVPIGLSMVLLDTKKPRALTESEYNERRGQCETAAAALGVKALRDATLPDLKSKRSELDETVYRRAHHVITENDRALAFKEALHQRRLAEVGRLMKASHVSLRDDYEVSCPELDAMAEAAWMTHGCVGARMMGAGFGGACIALVNTENLNDFVTATLASYKAVTGREGEGLACRAADGARILA